MIAATKLFNTKFRSNTMRLHPITYYKYNSVSMSMKDFQLIDLTSDVKNEDIKTGLQRVIPEGPFQIINRFQHQMTFEKVIISVAHERERNILKLTWSIPINSSLYRIAPINSTLLDINKKNEIFGIFKGFKKDDSLELVMDTLQSCNPKHAIRQSSSNSIKVFFINEADMYNACSKFFFVGDRKIKGNSHSNNDWKLHD